MTMIKLVALGLIALGILRSRASGGSSSQTVYVSPAYTIPAQVGREPLTKSTEVDGWVLEPPTVLAVAAGMDVETYTLARMIRSEFGSGRPVEKASIAWAAVNKARARGWSLLKLATNTSKYGDRGFYGSQEHGRYISTRQDPTQEDAHVAAMVLLGYWPDPTGGAEMFFDPADMDALHARDPGKYQSSSDLIASWGADGYRVVSVPGVRSEELTLLRRA